MKKSMLSLAFSIILMGSWVKTAGAVESSSAGSGGEFLFKKHCAGCHHNIDKLKRVQDIVSTMRNPPAVMPKFDEEKIPVRGAEAIARYIHYGPEKQPAPPPKKPAKKHPKRPALRPAVQSAPTRSL